jgi:hypothetical protein
MRTITWWRCGLLGAFALSAATLIKLVRAVVAGAAGGSDWSQALGFAALIFAMGFVCGVVGWAGRGLSRRFGMAGDALVGVAVMVVFFLGCTLVFAPEFLGPKLASGGGPMFGLAVVVGLVGGAWIGRDIRREIAMEGPPDADDPNSPQR